MPDHHRGRAGEHYALWARWRARHPAGTPALPILAGAILVLTAALLTRALLATRPSNSDPNPSSRDRTLA